MRAVDTNLLARYYLHDDARQSRIAQGIIAGGDLFIALLSTHQRHVLVRAATGFQDPLPVVERLDDRLLPGT